MISSMSIRKLAEALNLGRSTVSRALSGHAGVSPKNYKRVHEAAAKLGYKPNPYFSLLSAQKKTRSAKRIKIAYIDSSKYKPGMPAGVGNDCYPAACQKADELGYQLDLINPESFRHQGKLMDLLYMQGYVGGLVGRVREPDHAMLMNNPHFPLVCCGRIDVLQLHTVQPDPIESLTTCWKEMVRRGYRRIGVTLNEKDPLIADDLERLGAVLALQSLEVPRKLRVPPLRKEVKRGNECLEWFRKYSPDAVLAFSVGTYYILKDAGVDMRKIGFAAYHTSEEGYGTSITGVMELPEEVASKAIHLLHQLLQYPEPIKPAAPVLIRIQGKWQEGTTLPDRQCRD